MPTILGLEVDSPQDDVYERFVRRMNPPSVEVDNTSSETATLFKVASTDRHGALLELVQVLADLDISIHKAHITSDAGWFMDVFHVTDAFGNKVISDDTISTIEKVISSSHESASRLQLRSSAAAPASEHTVIELAGTDRPELMAEISASLVDMCCNVASAQLWTHNARVAGVLHVTDQACGGGPIRNCERLLGIRDALRTVLQGSAADVADHEGAAAACADFASAATHTERRLHQLMMLAGADRGDDPDNAGGSAIHADRDMDMIRIGLKITVDQCDQKRYSVVHIECRNRAKLLFDTVCTLTDMQYMVFHATINADGHRAYQEYYIRRVDGSTINSDAERRGVIHCLRAAIERRVSEGFRLELRTSDRVALLSDVAHIFREHGPSIAQVNAWTSGSTATTVLYVQTDSAANQAFVEAIRREMRWDIVSVLDVPLYSSSTALASSSSLPSSAASRPASQKASTRSKFSLRNQLFAQPPSSKGIQHFGWINPLLTT